MPNYVKPYPIRNSQKVLPTSKRKLQQPVKLDARPLTPMFPGYHPYVPWLSPLFTPMDARPLKALKV